MNQIVKFTFATHLLTHSVPIHTEKVKETDLVMIYAKKE